MNFNIRYVLFIILLLSTFSIHSQWLQVDPNLHVQSPTTPNWFDNVINNVSNPALMIVNNAESTIKDLQSGSAQGISAGLMAIIHPENLLNPGIPKGLPQTPISNLNQGL